MTGIATGSFIEASKTGELGVHSLDTFVMQVPGFKQAQQFFVSFGLDVRERGRPLNCEHSAMIMSGQLLSKGSGASCNIFPSARMRKTCRASSSILKALASG
jgi:hypothetical protein